MGAQAAEAAVWAYAQATEEASEAATFACFEQASAVAAWEAAPLA